MTYSLDTPKQQRKIDNEWGKRKQKQKQKRSKRQMLQKASRNIKTIVDAQRAHKHFNHLLTSLSPSRSTRQCRKPVWPTVTVTLRCNSKSKYGCSLSVVVIMPLLIVVISVILLLLFDEAAAVCDSLKLSVSEIGSKNYTMRIGICTNICMNLYMSVWVWERIQLNS